jgi:hypothetical protein
MLKTRDSRPAAPLTDEDRSIRDRHSLKDPAKWYRWSVLARISRAADCRDADLMLAAQCSPALAYVSDGIHQIVLVR